MVCLSVKSKYFLYYRNLEVIHTSPIKTYGKRKKHAVLFSDSSDDEKTTER